MSLPIFLSGCANSKAVLGAAAAEQARADVVGQAIAAGRDIPEQPADCRKQERHGIATGDRLDAATLKAVRALDRANARVARCASWHDDLRKGTAQ